MAELTPKEIVRELDRYIIGQEEAKKTMLMKERQRKQESRSGRNCGESLAGKPASQGKAPKAANTDMAVDMPGVETEN